MSEPFEPISEPYPSDFEPLEAGGSYAGPEEKSQPQDLFAKERQEILERMQSREKIETGIRLLKKMIDEKSGLIKDFSRQSDAERVKELEEESDELRQLLRDIQDKNTEIAARAVKRLAELAPEQ